MAGRQGCRGNGSGMAGGALAAAAVGSAIAAGAVGSMSRSKESPAAEETATCVQNEPQEDMPMCRHISPVSTTVGCCGVERRLWELNQVLDYQNKILVELLQAVRERS